MGQQEGKNECSTIKSGEKFKEVYFDNLITSSWDMSWALLINPIKRQKENQRRHKSVERRRRLFLAAFVVERQGEARTSTNGRNEEKRHERRVKQRQNNSDCEKSLREKEI